jgi:hypothetical protein
VADVARPVEHDCVLRERGSAGGLDAQPVLLGPEAGQWRERLGRRLAEQQVLGGGAAHLDRVLPVLDAPGHGVEAEVRPARDVAGYDDVGRADGVEGGPAHDAVVDDQAGTAEPGDRRDGADAQYDTRGDHHLAGVQVHRDAVVLRHPV